MMAIPDSIAPLIDRIGHRQNPGFPRVPPDPIGKPLSARAASHHRKGDGAGVLISAGISSKRHRALRPSPLPSPLNYLETE
jgi:hypothetical protein